MKAFLITGAVFVLSALFILFQTDHDAHQRRLFHLKFVAEEAAAAAAQFTVPEEYGEGRIVFNATEGIKAAEYVIKQNLKLNDDFTPGPDNYLQEQVAYTIEFFDDGNTVFPILYEDSDSHLQFTISDPTVVVKINAGAPRYHAPFSGAPDLYRVAAHTWKER